MKKHKHNYKIEIGPKNVWDIKFFSMKDIIAKAHVSQPQFIV